jgi:hypothetical protein
MFVRLPDPLPDPLVTSTDPAPDPSIMQQKIVKNLDFHCFVTSLCLFILEEKCKGTGVSDPDPYIIGPPGSASESVSQRYGSEDPDSGTKMSRMRYTGEH